MRAPRKVVPMARPATAALLSPLSLLLSAFAYGVSGERVTSGRAVDMGGAEEAGVVDVVSSAVVG